MMDQNTTCLLLDLKGPALLIKYFDAKTHQN